VATRIRQIVPLGPQWPTIDPFLFCAHHDDHYPNGNGSQGPDDPLEGREIGSDFAGLNGWNMYHGTEIPGFPQHPHRGFETVTLVRRGVIDHADSLGATARFGHGDVQWLTAGRGIQHAEMFPLLRNDEPNPLELFQIWLNLPASDKMVDPYFTMLWSNELPVVDHVDVHGHRTKITIVTGDLDSKRACDAPPNSWASKPANDVAIWSITMEPNAVWTMPSASNEQSIRVLYFFEGDSLAIDDERVPANHGAVIDSQQDLVLRANETGAQCLLLQGVPIGEPVARYGPFVMNTKAEIQQAFVDYEQTQFGGWPWSDSAPTHPSNEQRFAKHPNGRIEHPEHPKYPETKLANSDSVGISQ
jgi:quercetin 2,3-dioxygenase